MSYQILSESNFVTSGVTCECCSAVLLLRLCFDDETTSKLRSVIKSRVYFFVDDFKVIRCLEFLLPSLNVVAKDDCKVFARDWIRFQRSKFLLHKSCYLFSIDLREKSAFMVMYLR